MGQFSCQHELYESPLAPPPMVKAGMGKPLHGYNTSIKGEVLCTKRFRFNKGGPNMSNYVVSNSVLCSCKKMLKFSSFNAFIESICSNILP